MRIPLSIQWKINPELLKYIDGFNIVDSVEDISVGWLQLG